MICAKCKTFRCATETKKSEAPPFMFRPVKDEDATAVSGTDFAVHLSLTTLFVYCI